MSNPTDLPIDLIHDFRDAINIAHHRAEHAGDSVRKRRWQDVSKRLEIYAAARRAQPEGEAPQAAAWQPIETAPKTGQTLLLGRLNDMGNWRTMRGQWFTKAEIDQDWEETDGFEAGWYETAVEPDFPNCWEIAPTHWMTMPAAPAATLSPLCGAQHAESGKEDEPLSAKMHDVVVDLREYAGNPGYSHGDYADTMRKAASTIEALRAQCYHWGPALAAQSQSAQAAADDLLNMLGRVHPYAMPLEDFKRAEERLERAVNLQQPLPVPDQAAIVWRGDLMTLMAELQHKRSVFDDWKKMRAQQAAAPGALDADELTRLRRLLAALGHADAFELSDEYVRGELCHVLGLAAGKLERAALAAVLSAPGTPEAPKGGA
jgi:hypothetical protein